MTEYNNIKIVPYNKKYLEDVKDLLVELEEYLVSIDEDDLDMIHKDYRDKMTLHDLEEINKNNGKCYLAIENNKVLGLIMGIIRNYDEHDYLDYKCPKAGIITELIITKKVRSTGLGTMLINKIEEYFKSKDCEYSFVEVFAYNKNAINFYNKKGYHPRMYSNIKKL